MLEEAMAIVEPLGTKEHLVDALETAARIAVAGGSPKRGAQLLAAAARLRDEIGHVDTASFDVLREQIRERLPATTFQREWAVGSHMNARAAIREAHRSLASSESHEVHRR